MFDWRWEFAFEVLPRLLWATLNTLAASFGYLIALVIGLAFALLQRSGNKYLAFVVREIVEFIRSTPLVLQIFFVYFVGPQFGVTLSPWVAGMIAIGLHCIALNLSRKRSYSKIVIPQAIPPSIPALGNYLVGIFKDTPMLSVIGVAELMHAANAVGSETYRFLEPFTMVGVIFLLISLPTAWLTRRFEYWIRRQMGMN
jgi:polar amino acid transport system permease protein